MNDKLKKQAISHVVAFILGLVGGFFGKDLSPLQKPVETVVGHAVDAVENAAKAPQPAQPAQPAPAAVDAGPPPAPLGDPAAGHP